MLVKNAAALEPGVDNDDVSSVCQCLIRDECLTVLRTVGIGEFGVVQHAVWTKQTGLQVSFLPLSPSHSFSVCVCVCVCVCAFYTCDPIIIIYQR